MAWYFAILIILAAFLFMEFVAWFTHKYIMHGLLWVLHKDHHYRDGRKWEWNDTFAVFFALPSIVLIYVGVPAYDYKFWIGIGILVYGIAYFLFHDVYVHQRVKMLSGLKNRYLDATVRAHLDHHGPKFYGNYGFLIAPFSYYKEELRKKRKTARA